MPQEPNVPAAGQRGRILVEPPGYAVTSFITGTGLAVGLGLAPHGLLLFAAALILEVIELR
ncbi:MAG: hypothetical protein Q7T55_21815, partial [Solirubrobacteraceae bacterium]|nr:hypothetical protein [Solirubrobacteraceae bacterium]